MTRNGGRGRSSPVNRHRLERVELKPRDVRTVTIRGEDFDVVWDGSVR
jgi:hypothetical protein